MVELIATEGTPAYLISKYKLDRIVRLLSDTLLQQVPQSVLVALEVGLVVTSLIVSITFRVPSNTVLQPMLTTARNNTCNIVRGLLPTTIAEEYGLQDMYLITRPGATMYSYNNDSIEVKQDFSIDFVDTSPEAIAIFQGFCQELNQRELVELAFITLRSADYIDDWYESPPDLICEYIQEKHIAIFQELARNNTVDPSGLRI